ncbi:MAG: ATP-dependent DNA helicase [Nakamurella sp.]
MAAKPSDTALPAHLLVRRGASSGVFVPSSEQRAVIENQHRRLRILAGPGTGKTTTLVEAVAERITARRVRPEQILVLTFSRRAAAELASRIVTRLALTTQVPLVRTLHSYAFSLLRAEAARQGEPSPRLISAAESDQVIRELLAGHHQDGGGPWPETLHRALTLRGFAASVRDLLARTTERGLGPTDLVKLGRSHQRPEWIALGRFAAEYSRVLDLQAGATRQGQPLDQAELMGVALGLLRLDETLAAEQGRIRRIFVDEYQDVDPAQAALIETLAAGADELVVCGDPDQSVYAFRGSDPTALQDVTVDETVALTTGRRMAPPITEATRRVATLLPGPRRHRELGVASGPGQPSPGRVQVRILPSAGAEALFVADQLRRAHLLDGVAWSSMAVLVRSPAAALPALRRAFAVAGVPLQPPSRSLPMTEDRVVAALVSVLACGETPTLLTADRAAELMASPVGGLDALALRRLRRALRLGRSGQGSSMDLLAAVLGGAPVPELPVDLSPRVRSVREMIGAVRDRPTDDDAENVLWRVWRMTGLEAGLVATSTRGGLAAQRADATLDAVLQLFDAAAERNALVPGAGVADFLDSVIGRTVDDDAVDQRRPRAQAVTLLSAHASKGLEWDVAAVAGVQEGTWPNLGSRGDLLGTEDLLDAAAGLPAGTSRSASRLADERRLFYVATTRARRHLIVTAVLAADTQPSRFLVELTGSVDLSTGLPRGSDGRRQRGLNVAELVADLRRAVTDPNVAEDRRQRAAAHLATLADEGFRGADPDEWWGLSTPSTTAPPVPPGTPVVISPSAVENVLRCSLRAVLERVGGRAAPSENQIEGIVAHALAHGVALGVPQDELVTELDDWLEQSGDLTAWQLARQRRLILRMTEAARNWFVGHHPPWTVAGTELRIDAALPAVSAADFPNGVLPSDLTDVDATRPVTLSGRLDWLSHDEAGRAVVVDFKTTATPKSRADVQENPQLAAYQIAIAESPDHPAAGGGRLVYLKKDGAERDQSALNPDQRIVWIGAIRTAAARLSAADQTATVNSYCDICSVRTSCPLQPDGREVLG